jgi:threonine/homoserine/homoserine lactone efflux protein
MLRKDMPGGKWGNFSVRLGPLIVTVGAISLVAGMIILFVSGDEDHGQNLFAGFISGIGGAFLAFAGLNSFRYRRMSAAEKKRLAIESKDERNKMIRGQASRLTMIAGILFCLIAGGVFMLIDMIPVAAVFIGGLYLQTILYVVGCRYYGNRY